MDHFRKTEEVLDSLVESSISQQDEAKSSRLVPSRAASRQRTAAARVLERSGRMVVAAGRTTPCDRERCANRAAEIPGNRASVRLAGEKACWPSGEDFTRGMARDEALRNSYINGDRASGMSIAGCQTGDFQSTRRFHSIQLQRVRGDQCAD